MTTNHKTALITGASRGLGREIAQLLAERGMRLIIAARDSGALEHTASELRTLTDVFAIAGDVADPAHVRRMVSEGQELFGNVDILINNASTIGPSPMPRLEDYPLAELERVYAVNAIAPLHLIQLVLPGMRARGEGLIVNITSDAAVEAYPTWGGYGSSKAALEHISRVLATEVAGSGIRILTVDPGDMNTQMHRDAEPGEDLSHLPGPEVSARAIVELIEHERAPFRRVQAMAPASAATIGGR
jgi:NAD(P)-dependent dehydrogenase (short-subunit alcohol dehydrogenase family)